MGRKYAIHEQEKRTKEILISAKGIPLGQLWQQHNHPIDLSTKEMMDQRLTYIHNNPVEAGFVDDPCAWIWSSCAAYEKGVVGKLDLIFLE